MKRPAYYLAAALGLSGCFGGPARLGPVALPPLAIDSAQAWAGFHRPDHPLRYRLRWTYENQQGRTKGRAAVILAPPDSVRFDYRAPFGKSGAAVLVGDSLVWGRPEEDVSRLISVAPVFWAGLGVPRSPPRGWAVSGVSEGDRQIWRYAGEQDTLTYVRRLGSHPTLQAEYRQGGSLVGLAEVTYGAEGWRPTTALMRFPRSASRVLFSVEAIDSLATVDPTIWKAP
jgi:hypothetical protein